MNHSVYMKSVRRRHIAIPDTDRAEGFSLLLRFPLVTMLTFCMIIKNRTIKNYETSFLPLSSSH